MRTVFKTIKEDVEDVKNVLDDYASQMAENHARKIDDNFWLVVKQKPRWMPSFIYRAVIKNLVEFVQLKS